MTYCHKYTKNKLKQEALGRLTMHLTYSLYINYRSIIIFFGSITIFVGKAKAIPKNEDGFANQ